jgi:hypothetical protein
MLEIANCRFPIGKRLAAEKFNVFEADDPSRVCAKRCETGRGVAYTFRTRVNGLENSARPTKGKCLAYALNVSGGRS